MHLGSFRQPFSRAFTVFFFAQNTLIWSSLVGVFSYVKQEVLYNCFLDCLVALPIAARQQSSLVGVFSYVKQEVLYNCFLDCLVALPIAARQQLDALARNIKKEKSMSTTH
ncbi:hypothetical protein L3X38_034865 [Prunus dulcis]|uniref:Uncharacterized protein n=1 Tax=Prunus dulcis TaxID=3755 RepID=A0AAD4YY48_PRUDU|nr:hypothetical protein L3X38_034865 [Prunus dulcis]